MPTTVASVNQPLLSVQDYCHRSERVKLAFENTFSALTDRDEKYVNIYLVGTLGSSKWAPD